MHTRLFGMTNLSAALPPGVLDGDKASLARRLRDPATRRATKVYPSIITALARGDWSKIVLFNSRAQPDLCGRTLAEISAAQAKEPFDAICDLLLAELETGWFGCPLTTNIRLS